MHYAEILLCGDWCSVFALKSGFSFIYNIKDSTFSLGKIHYFCYISLRMQHWVGIVYKLKDKVAVQINRLELAVPLVCSLGAGSNSRQSEPALLCAGWRQENLTAVQLDFEQARKGWCSQQKQPDSTAGTPLPALRFTLTHLQMMQKMVERSGIWTALNEPGMGCLDCRLSLT